MFPKKYILVATISLCFIACNKNEDIVIDNPPEESGLNYTVIEYLPAPGQFINDPVIGFNNITSSSEAIEKATSRLRQGLYVSLGGWGGYIVVKFHESIKNVEGYDFYISSNSFDTSNEPGIVWVMQDSNGNGEPDDTWYELKGSYFGQPGYERNYWVTYTRPGADENTPWIDSNGETGEVVWMGNHHNQPFYYPEWIKENTITFYGSRLPSQAEQESTGLWVNKPFKWGYADNFGEDFFNDGLKNAFEIDNAVTDDNLPIYLESIDFVKVQTAINAHTPLLGENSTEVCGFFHAKQ